MMERLNYMAALCWLVAGSTAQADIQSTTETGFALSKTVIIKQKPDAVYAALGKPGTWWASDHSWSGDAKNMSMALKAGGCFCERLPANHGMVEHGRVIFASPGKMLRLSAALGPLQGEAVTARLTWTLKPVAGGTELTQTYSVGGFLSGGGSQWAAPVDAVVSQQLDRLKAMLEKS
jgi:uncharacterized protein YndB with AHSA1/START domain